MGLHNKYPSYFYKKGNLSKTAVRFIDFVFSPKGIKAIRENGALPVMRVSTGAP